MKSHRLDSPALITALLLGVFVGAPVFGAPGAIAQAASLVAPGANPAAGSPNSAPAVKKDVSKQLYTRQSESGSTVLGNGDAEAGDVALHLQAPPVVGGTSTAVPTAGRFASAAATSAVNGIAPSVDYTSNASRPDLKARDEKLATRVAQMYHRRSAFNSGRVVPGAPAAN